jgi:hypothetical protein
VFVARWLALLSDTNQIEIMWFSMKQNVTELKFKLYLIYSGDDLEKSADGCAE